MSANPAWPTAGAPSTGQVPTDNLILMMNQYVRLLVVQYSDKPKAQGLVALFAKQMLADDLATALLNAFNLSTAVGPQLDILGKYIGLLRNIGLPAFPPFFSFRDYNSGNPQGLFGFALYDGSSPADGAFYSYDQSAIPTNLTDAQYGFMLLLKIALNRFDGTLAYIQNYIANFLAGIVTVVDNQNMSLTYNVHASLSPLSGTLLAAYLPKPMGVAITVNFV